MAYKVISRFELANGTAIDVFPDSREALVRGGDWKRLSAEQLRAMAFDLEQAAYKLEGNPE